MGFQPSVNQGFYLLPFFFFFFAALGLCWYMQTFSSCGESGLLSRYVQGLLIAVASLIAEHGLKAYGFRSCGLQA